MITTEPDTTGAVGARDSRFRGVHCGGLAAVYGSSIRQMGSEADFVAEMTRRTPRGAASTLESATPVAAALDEVRGFVRYRQAMQVAVRTACAP
jgi:hypothetical protein